MSYRAPLHASLSICLVRNYLSRIIFLESVTSSQSVQRSCQFPFQKAVLEGAQYDLVVGFLQLLGQISLHTLDGKHWRRTKNIVLPLVWSPSLWTVHQSWRPSCLDQIPGIRMGGFAERVERLFWGSFNNNNNNNNIIIIQSLWHTDSSDSHFNASNHVMDSPQYPASSKLTYWSVSSIMLS